MFAFVRKIFSFFRSCLVYALLTVLLLLLVEGISSGLLIGLDLYRLSAKISPQRNHLRYDPDLGWSSKPNFYVQNMYAPGVYLKTNSQGFRNEEDIAPEVPGGKHRIICLGDSFTLGDGVSNDKTWCHQLSVLEPDLETVNMGQGGYGIDQAYLWYLRDGLKLRHQIVIFAFIADDFRRMSQTYPNKPYLIWNGEQLEVHNTPVSYGAYLSSRFSKQLSVLDRLRTTELIRMICDRFVRKNDSAELTTDFVGIMGTSLKVFEELDQLARSRGAKALFVYLPGYEEHSFKVTEPLRNFLAREFKVRRLNYLDLTESLKKYSATEARKFYLERKDVPFAADPETAARHYSPRGHQFVAANIYHYLMNEKNGPGGVGQNLAADRTASL